METEQSGCGFFSHIVNSPEKRSEKKRLVFGILPEIPRYIRVSTICCKVSCSCFQSGSSAAISA